MDGRKYYVICKDNCKFESMTKEQILAAITQAVSTGEINDIDAGFITKVKEQNAGKNLCFWIGSTAEYNAIPENERLAECLYIKTDDTFETDVVEMLLNFEKMINENLTAFDNRITENLTAFDKTLNENISKIPPQAEIIITTRGGEITCTDENGENIPPTTSQTTLRVFTVPNYGNYTITGTYKNITRTETVAVTAVKQHFITMEFYADNFADNDWETIVTLCKNNDIPATWNVGDTKEIKIGSTNYNAKIIGKEHDEDINGNYAPLTLIVETGQTGAMIDGDLADNSQGWENSAMRTTKMTSILNQFPQVLKTGICTVKKRTSRGDGRSGIVVTNDKLFLLSEIEINGTENMSFSGEGTQYEYFINGNLMFDSDPATAEHHWLRSPRKNEDTEYLRFEQKNNAIVISTLPATESAKIVCGFCL